MIKHTITDNILNISIAKKDFAYRIPVDKLGNTTDWKIGQRGSDGIVIKNVSLWTLQLFTKAVTEEQFVKAFMGIVNEHSPENTINWEDTMKALAIQNKYNWLADKNKPAKKKQTEEEIISSLKSQYQIE